MSDRSSHLDRLEISSPWMNAAGFLGYIPPAGSQWISQLGAFVTNAVSLVPRKPALHRMVQPFPGGFLLHTGYPNPGIHAVVHQNAEKWSKMAVPVWVHLLPQTPDELPRMVRILEEVENIGALELGIPPGIPNSLVREFIEAARGELPLIVCIGLDEIHNETVQVILDAGTAGLVLSAPRGMLRVNDHLSRGRIYGPAVFPQMLKTVCRLAQFDLPVIAGGGIYNRADGETLLEAGAAAIQLDAWLWHDNGD